jgi:hypothetical protein
MPIPIPRLLCGSAPHKFQTSKAGPRAMQRFQPRRNGYSNKHTPGSTHQGKHTQLFTAITNGLKALDTRQISSIIRPSMEATVRQ